MNPIHKHSCMYCHLITKIKLCYCTDNECMNGIMLKWNEVVNGDKVYPDSKVHGANMGPIWGRQDPGGSHVGPMNFAIWVIMWLLSEHGLKTKF